MTTTTEQQGLSLALGRLVHDEESAAYLLRCFLRTSILALENDTSGLFGAGNDPGATGAIVVLEVAEKLANQLLAHPFAEAEL